MRRICLDESALSVADCLLESAMERYIGWLRSMEFKIIIKRT